MKRSYISTPLVEPYMFETVPDRLKYLADEDPDREAFVFYNFESERVPVSRKQLYDTSINLAKVLADMGIQKGDRIAFCMNNSVEMLYANMAAITAGGVPFYLATNLKDGSDIIKTMSLMEPTMLIIDASVDIDNWKIIEKIWPTDAPSCGTVPSLKYIICNGAVGLKSSTRTRMELSSLLNSIIEDKIKLPALDPEDIFAYLVTSGSTGDSKNVAYTHFSLLNWSRKGDSRMNITSSSRFFNDRQFSWAVGYPRTYLATGATRIFIDTRMSLSGLHITRLADIIETEKCDVMYVPGYIAKDLINNPQLGLKFKSVHTAYMAGERIRKTSIALKNTFFKDIHIYYGTTEAGVVVMYNGDHVDDYEDGIIGKPIKGVEIKIVDDDDRTVALGEAGELCVRTPWRFIEYKGLEKLYSEVVDTKNWFHTGDIAHIRPDGNVVIDGRRKEHVVIQTVKYFPWDVENALKDCPGAQFVIAVGVPDPRLTNVFCVCVVPQNGVSLTSEDVKRYVDNVFLDEGTGSGITTKPKYCLIFDKLLLTSSGKINRRAMALEAKNRLGL